MNRKEEFRIEGLAYIAMQELSLSLSFSFSFLPGIDSKRHSQLAMRSDGTEENLGICRVHGELKDFSIAVDTRVETDSAIEFARRCPRSRDNIMMVDFAKGHFDHVPCCHVGQRVWLEFHAICGNDFVDGLRVGGRTKEEEEGESGLHLVNIGGMAI